MFCGTLGNNASASHVSQAFFDQDQIIAVELTKPHNTKIQELTENADDSILGEEAATDGLDPLFEYAYLGEDITDGIFAWIAFGINTTESQSIIPAAFYYEEGGDANPDSSAGGPRGSPPNGTFPSGVPSQQ
ncbi:hypothetical protein F4818DRAFT_441630 [Hypoxylon cercidicola]|nr:hypothetical protein F4818DRAFT_441630 [Hypoxylon cercidicola]